MWIPKIDKWNASHTDLSKYFIEKIKQKVDPTEIISNKHRTSNGYTLIAETIKVAENTLVKIRTIGRLVSLLDEATSIDLPFSIPNDFIIKKYHPDIAQYFNEINKNHIKAEDGFLRPIIIQSKIFLTRLQNSYYENIGDELKSVDFSSVDFVRNAKKIDEIVDCLIPLLLFRGYSTTSVDEIAYKNVFKNDGIKSPIRIYNHFNSVKLDYKFLLKFPENVRNKEMEGVFSWLDKREISYREVVFENIKNELERIPDFQNNVDDVLLEIKHSAIDPHNFIRDLFDRGLKQYVKSADRLDLGFFTHFLDNIYWKFSKALGGVEQKYFSTSIPLDPINVPNRGSTLRLTLSRFPDLTYRINEKLPDIDDLAKPTYFYNLALGSKSIENSLFLLWTCLETLLPYNLYKSDIENVQHFLSSSISFGTIIRELSSFVIRLKETNRVNDLKINDIGITNKYFDGKSETLIKWAKVLSTEFNAEDDLYDKLKPYSNLLCYQFCVLNEIYTGKKHYKVDYWYKKLISSELSIKHQLDRIYLHRNQIVHSGKFLNEYSNLWSHLEWYIGKVLAYSYHCKMVNNNISLSQIFIELEADAQAIKNILNTNRGKKINEIQNHFPIIFKHSWQST